MDPSWVISRVIFEVVTWWLTPGMVREITSRFVRHGTSFSHVPMAGGMRHWHTWLVLSKMVWKTHAHLDIRDDSKWPTLFIRVNQNYLRFLNMGRDTSLGGCTLHDTWVVSCLNLSKSSHNIPHLSADSQKCNWDCQEHEARRILEVPQLGQCQPGPAAVELPWMFVFGILLRTHNTKIPRFGYGSIPMKIPFLGGWTSINPSYFDVNYRGTRFWHTAIWTLNTKALNNIFCIHDMHNRHVEIVSRPMFRWMTPDGPWNLPGLGVFSFLIPFCNQTRQWKIADFIYIYIHMYIL